MPKAEKTEVSPFSENESRRDDQVRRSYYNDRNQTVAEHSRTYELPPPGLTGIVEVDMITKQQPTEYKWVHDASTTQSWVVGSISNNCSDTALRRMVVEFNLYDDRGVFVGTTSDTATVRCGDVWEFKIRVQEIKAKTAVFDTAAIRY